MFIGNAYNKNKKVIKSSHREHPLTYYLQSSLKLFNEVAYLSSATHSKT